MEKEDTAARICQWVERVLESHGERNYLTFFCVLHARPHGKEKRERAFSSPGSGAEESSCSRGVGVGKKGRNGGKKTICE